MTQPNKRLKKWGIACLAIVALGFTTTSCEEDNILSGTEIIGDDNLISEPDATATVIAFSEQLKSIQTNTLESDKTGVLGIHNNAFFGRTTMNLVAQPKLDVLNPIFTGKNTRVDSVKLHLPYFNRSIVETGVDTTYVLDSLHVSGVMKLEVFESKYFLRERDPGSNFDEAQAYYGDQSDLFEDNLGTKLGEVVNFLPNAQPIVLVTQDDLVEGEEPKSKKEIWEPGVYLHLDTAFFQKKIIDKAGSAELLSEDSFADYFRGIYFRVTDKNGLGSMFLFKMDKSIIRIYHSSEGTPEEGSSNTPARILGTLDINFKGGTKVETIEKINASYTEQQMAMQDSVSGSARLLLQGSGGIVSVVKLFGEDADGNGVEDELEELRRRKPLINDAQLTLYVDQDAMRQSKAAEPERIIIFNAETGNVLADYAMDITTSSNPLNSRLVHLGRLVREDGKGVSYKLRITNFVSGLINNPNMKNVALGIAVIPNVEVGALTKVKSDLKNTVKAVPSGILFSSNTTVIHGPKSENMEKRMKLDLYFTEVK